MDREKFGVGGGIVPAHGVLRDHPSAATILLVDDERGIRTVLRTLLQRNGYQVLEADGGEAANKIAGTHARIDLLLAEVMMPVISGHIPERDFNKRVRHRLPLPTAGHGGDP